MTCNDCIHYDACRNLLELFAPKYKDKNLTFTNSCGKFKNKTDFVEAVRCKDCKQFMEYSDANKRAVERADGDCFLRQIYSYDEQFIACRYNDFCSYGERK